MIGLGAAKEKSPRSPGRTPGLRALVVGSFMATAQAEVVSMDWDAQERFERSLAVAPGKSAEVCGRLWTTMTPRLPLPNKRGKS